MRETSKKNRQNKALFLAALLAASALGLAGCAKGEDANETMSSGIQEESAAQDESAPEGEQLGSEVIGRGAAFGLGLLEEMPEAFAQVVESNKEALKAYQEQAAKEGRGGSHRLQNSIWAHHLCRTVAPLQRVYFLGNRTGRGGCECKFK